MKHKNPSSRNLRKGRVSLQNQIYLVTFVTEERKHRFVDFHCARLMVKTLNNSKHSKTLAYIVMPDHVHWLIQLCDETPLGRVLQYVKSTSALRINHYLNRKGRFWQDGFHDHALRKEEAIKDAARYIIANPVRAGLVTSVRDYSHWDAVWV